jgi:acetylornithine deacetylase/succinyl-diaminopimelate desuccinylase-like protein
VESPAAGAHAPPPRSLPGAGHRPARWAWNWQEGSTGGGSDGNFTGALGVPTLDGSASPATGAHADDEHILVAEIPGRAALLAAIWQNL